VSGASALQFVRDIVACGPRFVGSPGHARAETYLRNHLKGIELQEDAFTIESPEGEFHGRNFIAKFPGRKDGIVVIAGHYDTPYPLRKSGFVGANDGGSGTGLLLELAQNLHKTQLEGYSVWLLWTDGEEAVKGWTATDSLYGVRHLAEKWQQDGTLKNNTILFDLTAEQYPQKLQYLYELPGGGNARPVVEYFYESDGKMVSGGKIE
jgi:hypothetical protein